MAIGTQAAVIGVVIMGAFCWGIWRIRRTYHAIGPAPHWMKEGASTSREFWIDETIEASFPASDPSSSTPVSGTGRCR